MQEPIDPNVYRSLPEKYVNVHQEKIILKYFKKRKAQHFNIKNNDLVNLISQDSGLDKHIVQNTISKYLRSKNMLLPKKIKEIKSMAKNVDNLKKSAIRKKIHSMWLAGKIPTIEKIITAVNIDSNLPRFNRPTMDKILKELKFDFVPMSGMFALIENDEIVRRRRHYLEALKKYRNEGRPIYFLGDTLIETNDSNDNTQKNEKHYSCPHTSKVQSEIRKKFIILHVGSIDGFVQGGLLGIESNKNSYDYHDDISSDTFMNWIKKVLPLLKENAVIVMNHTSYNSVHKVEYPDKTWTNYKIIEWLLSKGQIVNNDMIKVQLIDLVKQVKSKTGPYLIDAIANENNKVVLRIPTYHSELNAIEMAWNKVKYHVNTNSVPASKIIDIEKLIIEGIDLVTPEEWLNIIEYTVVKEEADCWNVDLSVNLFCDTHSTTITDKEKTIPSNDEIELIVSRLQSSW
ncbi:uncharacterized protein LOC112686863 isoform X1 [Sipha flava]|uniref:Uncharacterized protein LOC112686863 isoform X1 n=2 Tax=Sipha flava TaxID=143950 RepID=A0A2S2R7J6_9HEMI|nr:uncharacterized protein LOC112686863 isoform X1 [Sipha flava]XP_025415114.1 uncharacterized protein LOC112686863 isoform X1 [Sipha flava]